MWFEKQDAQGILLLPAFLQDDQEITRMASAHRFVESAMSATEYPMSR